MPTWTVAAEFTFDSAHFLEGYDGSCGAMHGHTYKVHIEAEADDLRPSEFGSGPAFVCDFRTLRWAAADGNSGGLDHCVLNDVLPAGVVPTAEMIAKYLCDETHRRVPKGVRVRVRVWETPTTWAEYRE